MKYLLFLFVLLKGPHKSLVTSWFGLHGVKYRSWANFLSWQILTFSQIEQKSMHLLTSYLIFGMYMRSTIFLRVFFFPKCALYTDEWWCSMTSFDICFGSKNCVHTSPYLSSLTLYTKLQLLSDYGILWRRFVLSGHRQIVICQSSVFHHHFSR